jgi:hypothetical protein
MRRATREPPAKRSQVLDPAIAAGDYLCSDRNLYRVEQLADGRVLIEDCRTGDLIDAPVDELAGLRRLDR